jgi:hypothetical protein
VATERGKQIFGGILATLVGGALVAAVALHPEGMADGVPLVVGIVAGGAFLLAGLVVLGHGTRWMPDGGLLHRVLVALLLTCFAGASSVFPPALLLVGTIAILGWMGVWRKLHEIAFGRDPMGGMSQEKQLGVGCLVTLGLIGAVALVVWIRKPDPPPPPLPAEAPDESAPPGR